MRIEKENQLCEKTYGIADTSTERFSQVFGNTFDMNATHGSNSKSTD